MSYNIDLVKVYNGTVRVVTAVVELDCSLNNGVYQSCFNCSRKSLYMMKLDCSLNNGAYQSCFNCSRKSLYIMKPDCSLNNGSCISCSRKSS